MDEIKEQALPFGAIREAAVRKCLKAARLVWAIDRCTNHASVVYGRELWEDISRGGAHADEFLIRPGPPDVMGFEINARSDMQRLTATVTDLKSPCGDQHDYAE